jgi:hypothetical protein
MNRHSYLITYLNKIVDTIEHPKLWAILTAIGAFVSQYIFSQWMFAMSFFIIFIMDTISGSYVAKRTGVFSGKIFREKLMDKSVIYMTIIISFSVATKMTLQESGWNGIEYLNIPFYTLFIVVELKSVINSWYQFKKWPWLGEILNWLDQKSKTIKTDENK